MKIRAVKDFKLKTPGVIYISKRGDIIDVPDTAAKEAISSGFAVEMKDKKNKPKQEVI